jgi:hypothetical protein
MLHAYFDEGFIYCEFYTPKNCCQTFPCTRTGINMSKNHDFGLTSELDPSIPLILQYRDFLPAVVSDFELYVRNGEEDSRDEFRRFAERSAVRYSRFINKWAHLDSRREKLVLRYEDLVADPEESLALAVRLFQQNAGVDDERIKSAVLNADHETVSDGHIRRSRSVGVRSSRDVRCFRYYDEQAFQQMAKLANA